MHVETEYTPSYIQSRRGVGGKVLQDIKVQMAS